MAGFSKGTASDPARTSAFMEHMPPQAQGWVDGWRQKMDQWRQQMQPPTHTGPMPPPMPQTPPQPAQTLQAPPDPALPNRNIALALMGRG